MREPEREAEPESERERAREIACVRTPHQPVKCNIKVGVNPDVSRDGIACSRPLKPGPIGLLTEHKCVCEHKRGAMLLVGNSRGQAG